MGDTAPHEARETKPADAQQQAPTPDAAGASSGPTHQVNALLANGTRAPEPYADVIRNFPAARDQIVALLQRTIGNDATRTIVQFGAGAGATTEPLPAAVGEVPLGPVRVNAPHGLRVRSTPDQNATENIVGMLAHHEIVHATKRQGEWLGVDHQGQAAYVFAHHVEPVTAPTGDQAPLESKPKDAPRAPDEAKLPTPPVMHADTPPPPPVREEPKHDPKEPVPDGSPAHANAQLTQQQPAPPQKTLSNDYAGYALDDKSYLQTYQHLNGGAPVTDGGLGQGPTVPEEAGVLNEIRTDHRKLDPVYLAELQSKLTIANNSGAMNTETLRVLRKRTNNPKLGKDEILKGDVLTALLPGQPIVSTATVQGAGKQGGTGAIGKGGSRADAMARVAGYESYRKMQDNWVDDIKLLDIKLPGGGMPALAERVGLADKFLKNRYQKDHDGGLSWQDVAHQKLHWSGKGNAAYGATAEQIEHNGYDKKAGVTVGPHMHSAGLALDIDGKHNPWVFTSGAGGAENAVIAEHLRYAAQIFGGEAVTSKTLGEWSQKYSTEELYARVDEVSKSLGQYLLMAENDTDAQIVTKFMGAGFTKTQAEGMVLKVHHFGKKNFHKDGWVGRYFQDQWGRTEATGLENQQMDLVVALRDVAGLAWGGTEMSEGGQNGDFMHFDLRNDSVGHNIVQFSLNNDFDRDPQPAPDADPAKAKK